MICEHHIRRKEGPHAYNHRCKLGRNEYFPNNCKHCPALLRRDHFRGHGIVQDNQTKKWIYEDTGQPVSDTWQQRPCGHCQLPATNDGHDGCLGTLPGTMNACCGHGEASEAYIQFLDEHIISGHSAAVILAELIKHSEQKD